MCHRHKLTIMSAEWKLKTPIEHGKHMHTARMNNSRDGQPSSLSAAKSCDHLKRTLHERNHDLTGTVGPVIQVVVLSHGTMPAGGG